MVELSPGGRSAFGSQPEHGGPEPLFDLDRLSFAVRARSRLIAGGAVLGLVLGIGLSLLLAAPPTAKTQLQIVRADADAAIAEQQQAVLAKAQQDLPASAPALESTAMAQCAAADVAGRAALALQMDAEKLAKSYRCREVAPEVVAVEATGANEEEALRRAQVLGEAFIEARRASAQDAAAVQSDAYVTRRAAETRELAGVVERTIQSVTVADAAGLLESRKELVTAINSLTTSDRNRRTQADVELARVFDPPRMVGVSRFEQAARAGAIGLVLGAGAAFGAALVAGVVRDRPVRRQDVARALGAPVLLDVRRPLRLRVRRRQDRSADLSAVGAALGRLVASAPGEVALLHVGAADVATALAERISDESQSPAPCVGGLAPSPGWPAIAEFGRLAVLVVRAGHCTEPELRSVARDLARAETEVLGIVLVDAHPRDHSEGAAAAEYYEAMAHHREWVRSSRASG